MKNKTKINAALCSTFSYEKFKNGNKSKTFMFGSEADKKNGPN